MIKMKKFLVSIGLLVLLSSCSGDDSSSSGNLNTVSIEVTGDFEAEKLGIADFGLIDIGSTNSWELNMSDINPQTFNLRFVLNSVNQAIQRPTPGTYEIGFETNSNSVFTAFYIDVPNGNLSESKEYTTLDENYGGTLTIDSSDNDVVTGSFEFTAAHVDEDFNVIGEINVVGEFEALRNNF